MSNMKIVTLTGGGDTQALNPGLRGIVKYACGHFGDTVLGIREGWKGLINELIPEDAEDGPIPEDKPCVVELTPQDVSGILKKGGTILGSSRINPYEFENGIEVLRRNYEELKADALIAIGGEDTLGVAYDLFNQYGYPVIGIPKTIDNDLHGTDTTLGFATACDRATEIIDAIHTTAESHNRIFVVEVMGRHTGWIALRSGMAGGADAVLIPEFPMTIDEVCDVVEKRRKRGKRFTIVVVAEGYKIDGKLVTQGQDKDSFDHETLGKVSEQLAPIIKAKIKERLGVKFEVKAQIVGHYQRGGDPNHYDRVLATRLAKRAVDLVHNQQFGRMAAIKGYDVTDVELREAVGEDPATKERRVRHVPRSLWENAKVFFG